MQAAQVDPENGPGYALGIDTNLIEDPDQLAAIDASFAKVVGAADPSEFRAIVPNIAAEYHTLVEQDWEANVLRG